jgi:hypothetical protein
LTRESIFSRVFITFKECHIHSLHLPKFIWNDWSWTCMQWILSYLIWVNYYLWTCHAMSDTMSDMTIHVRNNLDSLASFTYLHTTGGQWSQLDQSKARISLKLDVVIQISKNVPSLPECRWMHTLQARDSPSSQTT